MMTRVSPMTTQKLCFILVLTVKAYLYKYKHQHMIQLNTVSSVYMKSPDEACIT